MSIINPKCAAVSLGAVALYFTYPTRNDPNLWFNTAVLLGGTYVALAWYDAAFDCSQKSLASDWFTLYRPLKPTVGSESGEYGGL